MTGPSRFARRVEIVGELEVVTPLHIGSGEDVEDRAIHLLPEDRKKIGGNPESSRVLRDALGRPYIPGSSIKGALRSLAEDTLGKGDNALRVLFGEKKDEQTGSMGVLTIYAAIFKFAPKKTDLPGYEKKKGGKPSRGLFLGARTAIDDGTGTTEEHKLFHHEHVVPKTRFCFRATYFPPADQSDEAARELLARVLRTMEDGILLGKNTADGNGLVRLDLRGIAGWTLNESGEFERDKKLKPSIDVKNAERLSAEGNEIVLTLACDGPFFVNDSDWQATATERSRERKKEERESGKKQKHDDPQLRALRRDGQTPMLLGETVTGVLRARAEWITKLRGESLADAANELFGSQDAKDPKKARLVVERIALKEKARNMTMTSVRLDRFSGAPIDGALFGVDCFVDPAFELRMKLKTGVSERAKKLAELLFKDIKGSGLRLGHGGNRGFGWFDVEMEKSPWP